MEGRRGETRPCFILPIPLFPRGLGLVCDLVSHMMETHLILLEVNIFQWNRGDSRREKRDERMDGKGDKGIFKKLSLPLSAGPHIGLQYTFVCVCVSVPVYPHGMLPAAACISDRLLSRCFPLAVFLYLLHLCSLSEKVYPLGPI